MAKYSGMMDTSLASSSEFQACCTNTWIDQIEPVDLSEGHLYASLQLSAPLKIK